MNTHMGHRQTGVGVDADGSLGFHDGGGQAFTARRRHTARHHTAHRTGEHPR